MTDRPTSHPTNQTTNRRIWRFMGKNTLPIIAVTRSGARSPAPRTSSPATTGAASHSPSGLCFSVYSNQDLRSGNSGPELGIQDWFCTKVQWCSWLFWHDRRDRVPRLQLLHQPGRNILFTQTTNSRCTEELWDIFGNWRTTYVRVIEGAAPLCHGPPHS